MYLGRVGINVKTNIRKVRGFVMKEVQENDFITIIGRTSKIGT